MSGLACVSVQFRANSSTIPSDPRVAVSTVSRSPSLCVRSVGGWVASHCFQPQDPHNSCVVARRCPDCCLRLLQEQGPCGRLCTFSQNPAGRLCTPRARCMLRCCCGANKLRPRDRKGGRGERAREREKLREIHSPRTRGNSRQTGQTTRDFLQFDIRRNIPTK